MFLRLCLLVSAQFFLPASADDTTDVETVLTDVDFKNGESLLDSDEGDDGVLERGNYFEGDIKIKIPSSGLVQRDSIFGSFPLVSRYSLWPSNLVYYSISSRYTSYQRAVIASAMREYEDKTCIRFQGRSTERDYVYIFKDDGCYSLVGKVGGRQELSLDDDCVRKGVVIHELMHTVGFFHEQSRFDRDQFVDIVYRNIIPGTEDQFLKYRATRIDDLGVPYDYGSVLHYGPTAFSKNGRDTIVPKRFGVEIGQRRGFSSRDIEKINKLYECPASNGATGRPGGSPRPPSPGGQRSTLCVDIATNCAFFTDRCERQSIKDYCRKTCGVCFGASDDTGSSRGHNGKCEDLISSCQDLKGRGHCTRASYQRYMNKYCCAACS